MVLVGRPGVIDLMIISDSISYSDVYAALAEAERVLLRPINPTILTAAEWRQRAEVKEHFVMTLLESPKLFVLGTDDDLS
ncbi:MAG: hypothetical protein ACOX8V_03095 [Thermoleophilia bacterium]|jgi:hypothetical protein